MINNTITWKNYSVELFGVMSFFINIVLFSASIHPGKQVTVTVFFIKQQEPSFCRTKAPTKHSKPLK